MRAFIFPGQGSQAVGMGKALADASPVARAVFEEVDDALGQKLFALMTDGPAEDLLLTENAQPAIMANAIATLRVAEQEGGIRLADKADFVAGHSLGEYSALCGGGGVRPCDHGATCCGCGGSAMQAAVPVGEGAMAALLGADLEQGAGSIAGAAVDSILAESGSRRWSAPSPTTTIPSQVVISGHRVAIERAIALAKDLGAKRAILLPVSAPFHCPLIQDAADAMENGAGSMPT